MQRRLDKARPLLERLLPQHLVLLLNHLPLELPLLQLRLLSVGLALRLLPHLALQRLLQRLELLVRLLSVGLALLLLLHLALLLLPLPPLAFPEDLPLRLELPPPQHSELHLLQHRLSLGVPIPHQLSVGVALCLVAGV